MGWMGTGLLLGFGMESLHLAGRLGTGEEDISASQHFPNPHGPLTTLPQPLQDMLFPLKC